MKLYNTLSRDIQDISPLNPPEASVYTCGPTVYDYPHIGNWFTFIRYDVLVRVLKASGLKPKWVMNITDVGHLVSDADEGEDKLEKGAKREGKTAWDVARFYGDYFVNALDRLNMLHPDYLPKATDEIPEQIQLVKTLEEKGFTYVIDDGVYFDTTRLDEYGKLARLDIEHLKAGARVEANPQKRNITDFALWKFSPQGKKRDMEWWAPWQIPGHESGEQHPEGFSRAPHLRTEASEQDEFDSSGADAVRGSWGFPGWHLECSVMAMKYLGDTIDIHGGGIDHIPVHHTNEIAQSEAATGKPFSKYWFHANFILVDGKKMSKSLGNFYTLEDIQAKGYDLQAFRLLVLESHYRTEANFSWETLEAAQNTLQSFQAWADLRFQTFESHNLAVNYEEVSKVILDRLEDDLSTPQALGFINGAINRIEQLGIDSKAIGKLAEQIDQLLGLQLTKTADNNDEQKELLKQRQQARDDKDFAKSDELRDKLKEQKIGVRDTVHGQIWYRL